MKLSKFVVMLCLFQKRYNFYKFCSGTNLQEHFGDVPPNHVMHEHSKEMSTKSQIVSLLP